MSDGTAMKDERPIARPRTYTLVIETVTSPSGENWDRDTVEKKTTLRGRTLEYCRGFQEALARYEELKGWKHLHIDEEL